MVEHLLCTFRDKMDDLETKEPLIPTSQATQHCENCSQLVVRRGRHRASLVVSCILTSVATAILCWILYQPLSPDVVKDPSIQLYSPANEYVEYVPHVFQRSRGDDKTPFQGWPTDEIDRTWQKSYVPGIVSVIDGETASLLPEQTERLAIEGREDQYVMTLDVFHQMHCLDVVRMALYRDRYDKHFYFPNGTIDYCKWLHVDHCLDQVRQALMCSADVSVVHYAWSDIVQGVRPRVDNQHTCRNYSKLLDWASERSIPETDWHPSRRVIIGEDGDFQIQQGRNHAVDGQGECNGI